MKIYTMNIMKVYGIFTGVIYKKVILLFADRVISFPFWILGYDRKAGLEARQALENLFEREVYKIREKLKDMKESDEQ